MLRRLIRPGLGALRRGFCVATPNPGPRFPSTILCEADILNEDYAEMVPQFAEVRTEAHAIEAVRAWGHQLNDEMIVHLTNALVDRRTRIGPAFVKHVCPAISHILGLMTKDNSLNFGIIIHNLALLEIPDESLWQSISTVFERQRMEKYIPLVLLSKTVVNLLTWERPPTNLLARLTPELEKHKAGLPIEELQILQSALYSAPKAPEINP